MSKPRIKETKYKPNYGSNSISNIHINRHSIYYDNKIGGSTNFQKPTSSKNLSIKKKLNPNEVNESMTSISVSACGGTFGQEQIIPLSNKLNSNMNILTPQPIINTINQEEATYEISQNLNFFSLLKRIIRNSITKPKHSRLAHFLHSYIFLVVFCAVFTMCFETINSFRLYDYQKKIWKYLECFYTINLTLDWIIRLLTYPYRSIESENNNKRKLKIKNSFFKKYAGFISLSSVIDFFGTIPFYLELMFPKLAFQQINENSWLILLLRTFRIFRLFRLLYKSHSTTSKQLKLVFLAFRHSRNGLIMVLWVFLVLVILFSSLFFFAEIFQCELDIENQVWVLKTDKSKNDGLCSVQSIVDAYWWTVVTLSTVAYGDMTPLTPVGKIIGTFTIIVTLLVFFPIPSIIVSAHLTELIAEDQKEAAIKRIFERRNKKIQRYRINHDKNVFDNSNREKIKSTGSIYSSNLSLSRRNENKSKMNLNSKQMISTPNINSLTNQLKNENEVNSNSEFSRMTSLKDNTPYKSLLSLSLRNDIPSFPSHQSIISGKPDSSSSESSSSNDEDSDESDYDDNINETYSNKVKSKNSLRKITEAKSLDTKLNVNTNISEKKINDTNTSSLLSSNTKDRKQDNDLSSNMMLQSSIRNNNQIGNTIHDSVMNSIFNIQDIPEKNKSNSINNSKEFNSDSIEQLMFEQENFEDPEFIRQMLIEFCMLCDEEIKSAEERLKSLEMIKQSYEKGVMALQQIHQKDYI